MSMQDAIQNFIYEIYPLPYNSLFSNINNLVKGSIEIPDFPNRDHWFQNNVCYELTTIKAKIDEVKNTKVKDLLLCAFSKIIVKVSNQDSEVRYVAVNKNNSDGIVYFSFIDTVNNYLKVLGTNVENISAKAEVSNGDTFEVLKKYSDDTFDFVITSPPYINTFDYYLYHKQRMFWLGYDHRPVRQKEIGNHHRIDTKEFEVAKAEYIDSMTKIMNELTRVSKPNSYFIMIIGDGIVDGITIDMSQVIYDICENCHYEIEKIESINLSKITKSFNKKFSNAPKKEHTITLKNYK